MLTLSQIVWEGINSDLSQVGGFNGIESFAFDLGGPAFYFVDNVKNPNYFCHSPTKKKAHGLTSYQATFG